MTPQYTLGLFFVVLVAVIWSASSILVQSVYNNDNTEFHSPFMVTYLGVSLFTLWLLPDLWTYVIVAVFREQQWCGTTAGPHRTSRTSYQTVPQQPSATTTLEQQQQLLPWTTYQHIRAAAAIAPVWFIANWTYNDSLAFTSITSSTVLASTGSLFTFLFAVLSGDEVFGCSKLTGVLLGVLGSVCTAWQDGGRRRRQLTAMGRLWGDALGLVSAMGYGTYAIQTRLLCPHNEDLYSMKRLLGYIGLFNLVVGSPMAVYLVVWDGSGRMEWSVCWTLVVKGLLDNVLSDYLWLRAVMLTNATVATVGLGLTIPLAFLSDILLETNEAVLSAKQVAGAISVLSGFVLVNWGEQAALGDLSSSYSEAGMSGSEGSQQEMVTESAAGSTASAEAMSDTESIGTTA